MSFKSISRVAIGDPEIADVKTMGSAQLLSVGLKEGQPTLIVWTGPDTRVSHLIAVRSCDVVARRDLLPRGRC